MKTFVSRTQSSIIEAFRSKNSRKVTYKMLLLLLLYYREARIKLGFFILRYRYYCHYCFIRLYSSS